MARTGRKSHVSSAEGLPRTPPIPAGQQRGRSTSGNYGDRFIIERHPDASLVNVSPTKLSASASPRHVARIAYATFSPRGSHMLNLHRSTHSTSIKRSPLATPLPAHLLQTRYHAPNSSQLVKGGKVRRVKAEKLLDAPLMRADDEGCTRLITWPRQGLIVGINQKAYLWDPRTYKVSVLAGLLMEGETYIIALEWSARLSKLAICASDESICVVDPNKNNVLQVVNSHHLNAAAVVQSMCFADGLLTLGHKDGMVSQVDPRIPVVVCSKVRAHSGGVSMLQTSADGKYIATGGDNHDKTVKIWDRRSLGSVTVQPYWSKHGLLAPTQALAWCPWKTSVLAMDDGPDNSTLQCWNVESNELVSSVETSSTIRTIQFPPLAKQIVTTHGWPGNSIQIHRYPLMSKVATGTHAHHDPVSYAAINPQGTILATGSEDQTIRMWRFRDAPTKRTCHPSEKDDVENMQVLR